MKKTKSLTKKHHFNRAYKNGKYAVTDSLVVYAYRNNLLINKLGIVTKKNIANSVKRNYLKRIIREIYRQKEDDLKTGYDLVFVIRKKKELPDYNKVKKDMLYVLKKVGMEKKDK